VFAPSSIWPDDSASPPVWAFTSGANVDGTLKSDTLIECIPDRLSRAVPCIFTVLGRRHLREDQTPHGPPCRPTSPLEIDPEAQAGNSGLTIERFDIEPEWNIISLGAIYCTLVSCMSVVATNALDEGEAGEVGSKPTGIVEGIALNKRRETRLHRS
jgi:hypothetical protein